MLVREKISFQHDDNGRADDVFMHQEFTCLGQCPPIADESSPVLLSKPGKLKKKIGNNKSRIQWHVNDGAK